MLPDYWPWMLAYHRVREPLYRCMLGSLGLSPRIRVLDAGSGDTFYSQLLSSLLGPTSQIVALDHNWSLLQTACDRAPNILRAVGDLERPAFAPASFDAVWLCRSMHSAPDPLARLAALVPLLRRGGRFIVVENDTAHYPILPLPAEFEHRLRDARLRYERSRCSNMEVCERYRSGAHLAAWFRQLGLVDLAVHTYVSEDLAPLRPDVENYWRLFLSWDAHYLEPFLSPADAAHYHSIIDPYSRDYLFSQPGCYCLELTTLAVGTVPGSSASAWKVAQPDAVRASSRS